jgi:hypothetical protein
MTCKSQPPAPAERSRNAVANAFAALQLVVFRRPTPSITGRPRDVVVAILIFFLTSLAAHRSYFSGDVEFSVWGFQGWIASIALWYLAVTAVAMLVRREAIAGAIFVTTSMALLVGIVLTALLYHGFWDLLTPTVSYVLFWVFGFLPLITAMITLTMSPRRRDGWRGLVISIGGIALASVTALFLGQQYLFEEVYADDASVADIGWAGPDPEVIYPLQSNLLADQIDVLFAQTHGQTDIYAVLGAGTPSQQIFQREIEEMQRILGTRFGAQGRTIMLGATMQEQTARPLLNRTNLTASLHAIAETMDISEDIGLIFLTSHGSPERLSTYFPGLSYSNLTSSEVANALDESGIQNAIIIISSCYSGSFVDDLAGPTRLVLTASAADRSSFGCSESNMYTDWGSAFFANIMHGTMDLRLAAQATQASVGDQENERDLKPSMPQISAGSEIGVVIDRYVVERSTLN